MNIHLFLTSEKIRKPVIATGLVLIGKPSLPLTWSGRFFGVAEWLSPILDIDYYWCNMYRESLSELWGTYRLLTLTPMQTCPNKFLWIRKYRGKWKNVLDIVESYIADIRGFIFLLITMTSVVKASSVNWKKSESYLFMIPYFFVSLGHLK